MVGRHWTNYKIAVVVYFASREADYEGCCKILHLKGGPQRTAIGVRSKLDSIRAINGLWNKGQWNRGNIDQWLLTLGLANLNIAISTGL